MRPAALMRGAMRNPTSPEVRGRPLELRHFEQSLESGIDGRAQSLQSELGEYAVLTRERHRVGNGCDRYDFRE